MKKFLLLFLVVATAISVDGQSLKKDYIDEFTKARVLETNIVQFSDLGSGASMECSFKAAGTELAMILKAIVGGFAPKNFSVDEGEKVVVLLSDGVVVKFNNLTYTMTSIGGGTSGFAGCNAPGITLIVFSDEIQKLADDNVTIEKFRIYTNSGYIDASIKPNKAKDIRENLKLIVRKMDKTVSDSNKKTDESSTNNEMTSEEALKELSKWKQKLDLQIITQEEYDKKKEELMKYID